MKYPLLVKSNRVAIAAIATVTIVAGGYLTYYFVGSKSDRSADEPVTQTQVLPQTVAAIGYLEPQGEVINGT